MGVVVRQWEKIVGDRMINVSQYDNGMYIGQVMDLTEPEFYADREQIVSPSLRDVKEWLREIVGPSVKVGPLRRDPPRGSGRKKS